MRPGDPTPTSRNLDPLLHPFARARERTRALNAAKIERIFAKPFVASLEGHSDAVEVLVRKPKSLTTVASASWDGGAYVVCLPPLTTVLLFLSPRDLTILESPLKRLLIQTSLSMIYNSAARFSRYAALTRVKRRDCASEVRMGIGSSAVASIKPSNCGLLRPD